MLHCTSSLQRMTKGHAHGQDKVGTISAKAISSVWP